MKRYGTMILTAAALTSGFMSMNANAAFRPGKMAFSRLPEGTKQFRASANHICWSKEIIGYSCYVSGVGYSDCNVAGLAMKSAGGCCANYKHDGKKVTGGASTGIKDFSCTWWH